VKKRVYIETSIVSYLTARPSRDLIQAARQQITSDWWEDRKGEFDLFVSQYVLDEAGDGDLAAARRRLELLNELAMLDATEETEELGRALITEGPIPQKATIDALHIAVAAVHEMDILLTWNCKHLANVELFREVERVIRSFGYEPPMICTPDELMGE
jgi:hypothetical protein